jgi:hypothetical protein
MFGDYSIGTYTTINVIRYSLLILKPLALLF